jgi:hypothetical protein
MANSGGVYSAAFEPGSAVATAYVTASSPAAPVTTVTATATVTASSASAPVGSVSASATVIALAPNASTTVTFHRVAGDWVRVNEYHRIAGTWQQV